MRRLVIRPKYLKSNFCAKENTVWTLAKVISYRDNTLFIVCGILPLNIPHPGARGCLSVLVVRWL